MGRGGMNTRFWWESQNERNHYEDLAVSGMIILKWTLQKQDVGGGGMDWILLAQDKDQWRALGNTLMNLWVP
jgi:hypothetical protein